MDKLTSILAVAETATTCLGVLDKALLLARRFDARVELLVTDGKLMRELATHCAERGYDRVTLSSMHRGNDSTQAMIVHRALDQRPDLVIKSAGAHPLRRWTLDASDRRLAADCPAPLLLTIGRPWNETLRMAAAVDVADVDSARFARAILQAAGFLALGSGAQLDVLYSEREERDERVRMERAVMLCAMVREFHVGGERLRRYDGAPERTLPPLIAERYYDLLVIGAVTHRTGMAGWTETLSSRLADATAGDVLLVKPVEREAAGERPLDVSLREQRTNLA